MPGACHECKQPLIVIDNRRRHFVGCLIPQSLDRQRGHRRAAIREGSGDATCVKEDSEAAATGLSFPEMMDASPGIEKPRRNGSCAGALADRQHPQTIISVVTLRRVASPQAIAGIDGAVDWALLYNPCGGTRSLVPRRSPPEVLSL